ncbi:conserved hypothetical protein [uncultured spirochete]|uniref:Glycosyl transferase family 1 domain-containing protein n=1 Tax=uncultured spirochete TaxID=156406 RepID=A0A3P3XR08_9SPIR|nr:conserved hypothetical protein [uncultured spirochete]
MRKIFFISASIIEYDGRLRELIEVSKSIGETYYLTRSNSVTPIDEHHIIFTSRGPSTYINFLLFCFKTARKIGKFDVIWADNRKALIPSFLIARLRKHPILIQDARELYMFGDVRHFIGKIGCLVEIMLNRKFDIIICANKERAEIMKRYYHLRMMPLVFENVRKLEFDGTVDDAAFEERYQMSKDKARWKIISTSGCDLDRGIEQLVEAVGRLGEEYSLYIFGNSSMKQEDFIERKIMEIEYKNIHIFGPLKQDELKYAIGMCDIGVVNYHAKDMNNKYCASGKLYEFIFEGVPVITTENPSLKALCERFEVGISCNDYQSAIRKLTEEYEYYQGKAREMSKKISVKSNRAGLKHHVVKALETIERDRSGKYPEVV